MRIVIDSASSLKSPDIDRLYTDMKDTRKKSISAKELKANYKDKIEIYIYYEKTGLNNGGEDHSFTIENQEELVNANKIQLLEGPDGQHTKLGNDSYRGRVLLVLMDTCTVKFKMVAKQNSTTFHTFTINVRLEADSDPDDSRGHGMFNDVLTNTDYYTPIGGSSEGIDEIENKVSVILTVITNIGIVLCVLVSAILGIKYMLASVEAKAEIKQDLVPYAIGASLLFGICVFVKILQAVGSAFNT